jgi:hypothetical protein
MNIQITGAAFQLVLGANPVSLPADGVTVGIVSARLVDAAGVTIISGTGTTIQFATTAGTLLTVGVVTSTTDGIATAYIKAPSSAGVGSISAVGGGVSGALSMTFTTPGTTYVETLTTPVIKDTSGNVVTAPKAGNVLVVASTITNTGSTAQQTTYIVQIKNSAGAVVYFTFLQGSIPANTSMEFGAGWTPTVAGTYTVQVFAWNSFASATPLSPPVTTTVIVA